MTARFWTVDKCQLDGLKAIEPQKAACIEHLNEWRVQRNQAKRRNEKKKRQFETAKFSKIN